MLFKKSRLRVMSFLFAMSIMVVSPAAFPSGNAKAATLAEMLQESERLHKEEQALDAKIDNHEKNLDDQKAYKSTLDSKIANTTAQIDLLGDRIDKMNAEIDSLNKSIEKKEEAIVQKEEDIAERFETLRLRLRAISKTGNLSTLQMLMNTDDYTDYLIKSKMIERVAKRDKALMEELEAEIEAIDAEKGELNTDKENAAKQLTDIQKLKNQANTQKAGLNVLYGKANAALKNIQSNIKYYEQQKRATEKEQEELEKQIQQIINKNSANGQYSEGSMYWPVPTVRSISSYYGMRWGRLHRGIDIANGSIPVYGQNIVAASSGTVIYANYTNRWGGGYGYHVIIDHGVDNKGNKISTLYAHCSKVLARVGNRVTGGQTVIAKAGDTGNVTGPHLHFEVRVNGVAVDPIARGYIKR